MSAAGEGNSAAPRQIDLVRRGRVWKFGEQINTDLILPMPAMRLPPQEMHTLAFSAIRPGWVNEVRPGDLLIAGENFALGSGRPIGAVLRACGIVGVVADSINGMGFRNCLNAGLPALAVPGIAASFDEGDEAEVDFIAGTVTNRTSGRTLRGAGLAPSLAEIVVAGGLIPMLVKDGYVEPHPFTIRTA
jgi:3-isopropylmalate/(R)-2-methylmalate dehydratase small subunit